MRGVPQQTRSCSCRVCSGTENEFPPCQHVSAYAFSSTGAMFPPCGSLSMKFIAVPTAINWGSLETLFPKLQSSVHVLTLPKYGSHYNSWLSYQQTFLQMLMGAKQRADKHFDLIYCHSWFWQPGTICLASWIRWWVNHRNFLIKFKAQVRNKPSGHFDPFPSDFTGVSSLLDPTVLTMRKGHEYTTVNRITVFLWLSQASYICPSATNLECFPIPSMGLGDSNP